MDERMMKAMVAAGAIKRINIIANGARFHIEAKTPNGPVPRKPAKEKCVHGSPLMPQPVGYADSVSVAHTSV